MGRWIENERERRERERDKERTTSEDSSREDRTDSLPQIQCRQFAFTSIGSLCVHYNE